MEISEHVVNLELSKKLKALGVPQKSMFYWVITLTTNYHISYTEGYDKLLPPDRNDYCSAYLSSELGRMLPFDCFSEKTILHTVGSIKGKWVSRKHGGINEYSACEYADNETDSRAKMLIYLIENNLMKVEDLWV